MPIGRLATEAELDRFVRDRHVDRLETLVRQLQGAVTAATKLHTTDATTSGPTFTSSSYAALAEMTVTADFSGNPVLVVFSGRFQHTTSGAWIDVALHDAGAVIEDSKRGVFFDTNSTIGLIATLTYGYTPALGSRTLDIRVATSGATATAYLTHRNLTIIEFGTVD